MWFWAQRCPLRSPISRLHPTLVMATARLGKERLLKEVLTWLAGGPTEESAQSQKTGPVEDRDEGKNLVTRSFMESLFASLQEDLQASKGELAQGLKDIHQDLTEVGNRALEDHESGQDEELEKLQQEVLRRSADHIAPNT
ncbi:hypothetical protein NDU88_003823 [Pleurodeles waltl]|uniref:Uncharacterized protein n=1 Tax=Pleurodeles waltl TaxID=8319 RepID=A0AAV7W6I6_PLEWA|nr:hypothetical protein NDU88_003823 [Pleurodeles waltl]